LVGYLIALGVLLTFIGGAQLWQTHQFNKYQACQATHDRDYDAAQRARTDSSIALSRARFEYDQAVLPLFDPKDNDLDAATLQRKLRIYIAAAQTYFKDVEENPYPESTAQLCGVPKG
jgi:hypothetical protein